MRYKKNNVMIGIAGPISGDRAAHAPLVFHAADCFWQNDISSYIKDDKADPEAALAVANKFVDQGVACVVGHFNSACAQAVKTVYKAANIPVFLPASTQTNLMQDAEGTLFRMCSTDFEQARLVASCVEKSGIDWRRIEIVKDQSPYAGRLLRAFESQNIDMSLIIQSNVSDKPCDDAEVRIVLATCSNALKAADSARHENWAGTSIYMDDAHVDAFAESLKPSQKGRDFVIGSKVSYENLISQACDIVTQGITQEESLLSWLSKSPLFDRSGQKIDAGWQIYSLHDRRFVSHHNCIFGG